MINTIIAIAFGVMVSLLLLGIMSMLLEDTDTFRAIDEKIARWIRGKGKTQEVDMRGEKDD